MVTTTEVPLTGEAEEVQLLLRGSVQVRRGEQQVVRHEEVVGAVGAPQAHQAHRASVVGLGGGHHGGQLAAARRPPHRDVEAAGVDGRTAIEGGALHGKVPCTPVHQA